MRIRGARVVEVVGRAVLLGAAVLLLALLVSWPLSYYRMHGVTLNGFRRYGIVCYQGVIQLQHGQKTQLDGFDTFNRSGRPLISSSSASPARCTPRTWRRLTTTLR